MGIFRQKWNEICNRSVGAKASHLLSTDKVVRREYRTFHDIPIRSLVGRGHHTGNISVGSTSVGGLPVGGLLGGSFALTTRHIAIT